MTPPDPDVPDVPDLLDHGGRLRRMAIAAALGVLAAVVVATLTYAVAGADAEAMGRHSRGGAWRFIIFFTGLAWIVTFIVSSKVMASREKQRNPHMPRAVARRKDA